MLSIKSIDCIDKLLNKGLDNFQEAIIVLLTILANLKWFKVKSIIISLELRHHTK